jgi:hypothetical protein
VLVVVGILIALYINNWNEERKEREKIDQVLVEVEKELISNIERSRISLNQLFHSDSIYELIITNKLEAEDYRKDILRNLSLPMIRYPELAISNVAFEKLVEVGGEIPTELDSVFRNLTLLYSEDQQFVEVFVRKVDGLTLENHETLFTKQPWYRKWVLYQEVNESEIQFFLRNEEYLNRAAFASKMLGLDLRESIEFFEIRALNSYHMIHQYLKSRTVAHLDSTMFEYDPLDYSHYIGTYIKDWSSSKINFGIDSTLISIEDGKLYYAPYYNDGRIDKREIIPVDKYKFRTVYRRGFYRVKFDNRGEVVGISIGNGALWETSKKIR